MNQHAKTYLLWIIGIVVVLGLVWWLTQQELTTPAEGETIKIGYIGPLTGPVSYTGEPVVDGIRLAHEEQSTVGSMPIEIIYEDGACDAKQALSAAQKLIEVDNVSVIISGVCSTSTLAIAPVTEANQVVLISPVAASPDITTVGDYVFRTSGTSVATARATAQLVYERGIRNVGILFETDAYAVGEKDAFVDEFTRQGGSVVTEAFATQDKDLRTQLTKLQAAGPDALFFITFSTPSADSVLKGYAELAGDIQLIGNEVFSFQSVIEGNQKIMEGMFVPTYDYDSKSPALQKFAVSYEERFNKELSEEIYGALAYDMYGVLYEAIRACGGDDSDCVRDRLYETSEYEGISGEITIDENGDTDRQFILQEIRSSELIRL